MKCQSLFSGRNKNNITNLLSAEPVLSVIEVKISVLEQTFCMIYSKNQHELSELLCRLSVKRCRTVNMKCQFIEYPSGQSISIRTEKRLRHLHI